MTHFQLNAKGLSVEAPRALFGAAIALGTGVAVVFGRPAGIAFWSDSVSYFSAAESLASGALLTQHNQPVAVFPPIYPMAVALALGAGLDRQTAAFLINLLAVVTIAVVVCRVMWSRTGSIGAAIAILTAALLLGPVPGRLRYAGTELLFMALTLLALDQADRKIWRRGAVHALGLGLLCSLAFLTRYTGVVLAATVGVWILADMWRLRSRMLGTVLWFAAGVAPVCVGWLLRNAIVAGTLMGSRRTAMTSVAETLTGTASTLVEWALPRAWWVNRPLEWVVVFGGLSVVAVAAVLVAYNRTREIGRTVVLYITFAVAYTAFVAVSSLYVAIDIINDRLLAPAFIPAVLGAGIAAVTARASHDAYRPRPLRRRAALAWVAVVGVVVTAGAVQALRRPEPAVDFMSAEWRNSPTTRAAAGIGLPPLCFSNAPAPLYLGTGYRCARALTEPYRTADSVPDPLLGWLETHDARTAYFVWYYHSDPHELLANPRDLLGSYVRRRVETPDGELLEVRADGGRSAHDGLK